MEYLNDIAKYPARECNAIAYYYSYEVSVILYGIVNRKKELLVIKECEFHNENLNTATNRIKSYNSRIWINKNIYLNQLIGRCYGVDLNDEYEILNLEGILKSLINENKIFFKDKKVPNREKALPIILKALSYPLFCNYYPGAITHFSGMPNAWDYIDNHLYQSN